MNDPILSYDTSAQASLVMCLSTTSLGNICFVTGIVIPSEKVRCYPWGLFIGFRELWLFAFFLHGHVCVVGNRFLAMLSSLACTSICGASGSLGTE